jgi:histidyl-tRNA synthetase
MELQTPKGTRDISGSDARAYDYIISRINHYFKVFGFETLHTPHFERMSVLTSKFSGGEEITKEIFSFGDQGKRSLGLRYDHTIPLSRFIASRPDIPLPYQRASVGSVFRDGPVKTGRLREFTQADADICGAKGINAEVEILSLMSMIYDDMGVETDIQLSHRALLESIITASNVPSSKVERTMLTIDKLHKIGKDEVIKELQSYKISKKSAENIFSYIDSANDDLTQFEKDIRDNESINADTKSSLLASINDIMHILRYKINNVRFEATLARGLNYYTGVVFEAFIKDSNFKSSIAAGGRYRSIFLEGQESVGVSFGIDAMMAGMQVDSGHDENSIYVIPVKDNFGSAHSVARVLRRDGVVCGIDVASRSVGKNLKHAASKGYNYALIVGDDEVASEKYTLRNLGTGVEQKLPITDLIRMFTIQKL